jgi:hypothetical protein
MKLDEQLKKLYQVQTDIRILQESGLWESLQPAKEIVIKLIKECEAVKTAKGEV